MVPFFLSLFGWDWLQSIFQQDEPGVKLQNDNLMVNFINDDVWRDLKAFLKVYEGYHPTAYNLGDGAITIGYGSTNWLSPTGKVLRPVRMGDTITEQVAEQQMRFYFASVIPSVNSYLAVNSISVSTAFLVAMLNFCYMSGPGFMTWTSTKQMFLFANKNNFTDSIRENVKASMLKFWKSIKFASGSARCRPGVIYKYDCFGLGWSRRLAASLDVISGNVRQKSYYDRNIKKAF